MAGLLDRHKTDDAAAPAPAADASPQAPVVEPAPAAPEPAPRACATCTEPLADGQDWCLECGAAQPGRLGGRPGWRAALTVVGACALLATGAGAAAYAALQSESQRVASAPPPPAAAPVISEPPPVAAPPPAEEEVPEIPAPASEPADVPEVQAPADVPEPVTPPASGSTGTPATGGDAGTGDAAGDDPVADEPVALELSADDVSTYDPYDRAGTEVGDPADAVDGKARTRWEAPVGEDGEVRIGLAVSLDEAQTLSQIAFDAGTPGFTVEVYGSRAAKLPPDILDARWENLGMREDVGLREEVDVEGKFRHVVLWFTAQPADTIVRIPEIELYD